MGKNCSLCVFFPKSSFMVTYGYRQLSLINSQKKLRDLRGAELWHLSSGFSSHLLDNPSVKVATLLESADKPEGEGPAHVCNVSCWPAVISVSGGEADGVRAGVDVGGDAAVVGIAD